MSIDAAENRGILDRGDLTQWLGMLETIVDGSTNMVVITDAQRRITWVNATYTRVTGWALEECVGKLPRELLHGPQTNGEMLSRLAKLLKGGSSIADFELLNYKKSGEPYHVSLNIEPIRDSQGQVVAYFSIQSDITERRRMELDAAELRHRLEVAQRLARLGRIEIDPASGQSRWSSEIFRIVGMDVDLAPRGLPELLELAHLDDGAAVSRDLPGLFAQGEEIEVEFRVAGLTGGQRWVRCCGLPQWVEDHYEAPGSWSVQDITIYKQRLEEKRLRNEMLNQLVLARTRKLEESNRALEEFSYALSHDLRTPLRHMAGFASLLKEALEAGETDHCRMHCDKIIQAGKKMQGLIEGMLSFARLGREGLSVEGIDLSALLGEVIADLRGDTGERHIVWRMAPDLPVIQGDPLLLREVWVNLLDNALKYSGNRVVSEVEVGWHRHQEGRVFFVRDNGVGFEPANADKLFGIFERLHRDGQFSGEGIGLALVRRIVESHGGRIWANAQPGKGATFYFYLPMEVDKFSREEGLGGALSLMAPLAPQ